VSEDPNEKDLEMLEEMLKEVISKGKSKEKPTYKKYFLTSTEDMWFYNPTNRQMVRIPGGCSLLISDLTPDADGKVMCYTDYGYAMIPEELIAPLGYN
tara:strand:+ start:230 stop:523 length:294 start_codon:yes stop_codon:yes gene_type:complete